METIASSAPAGEYRPFRYGPGKLLRCAMRESKALDLTQQFHHHDYYQIYYVTRGNLTHYINGVSLKVMRGDCFIVPPYVTHKVELEPEGASFISFSFYEDFLPDYVMEEPVIRELMDSLHSSSLLVRVVLQPQDLMLVEQAIHLAKDEFDRADVGYESILRGQLASILVAFSRAYKYIKRVKHDNLLLPCLEYINANFSSPITAKDVASRMYLSESTFYRYFKQIVGHSFKNYLTMLRIRNACILLKDPSIPISQVAARCGYVNYSVFYRAFLLEMQISPAAYQKLAANAPQEKE